MSIGASPSRQLTRHAVVAAVVLAAAGCASGFEIEARGDGWTATGAGFERVAGVPRCLTVESPRDAATRSVAGQGPALRVTAIDGFGPGAFPFRGRVRNLGASPASLVFRPVGAVPRADSVIARVREDDDGADWREAGPGEVVTIPARSAAGPGRIDFCLPRTSGPGEPVWRSLDDGTYFDSRLGDAARYVFEFATASGIEECPFEVAIARRTGSSDFRWWMPIVAVPLLPFFLLRVAFGGGSG